MRGFVAIVLSFLSVSAAIGQSLPDFPPYKFRAFIGGVSTPVEVNSDSAGVLDANAGSPNNRPRSFHLFSLETTNPSSPNLKFVYSCVYRRGADGVYVTTPTYDNGEHCPKVSSIADSAAVKAFRVDLEGSDKDHYVLEYSCDIGYFNQANITSFSRQKGGNWCGNREGGAPNEWITRATFYLRRL